MITSSRAFVVSALGVSQIIAWGCTFYLPAVLAPRVALDTGWPLPWIVGGTSLGLLVSALISPRVGRAIERHGGRRVLASSAVLLTVGQIGLALSPSLPAFIGCWVVLGIGMGCGLFDASFATLGRLYGREARRAITILTLWGGFASTVCWPLSAFLIDRVGWRGTCLAYAALLLVVVLPTYLLVLLRPRPAVVAAATTATPGKGPVGTGHVTSTVLRLRLLALLLVSLPATGAVLATWSVHLLTLLQAAGLTLASAVMLGALVGPAQAASRIVEMVAGRAWHPIWSLTASAILVAAGVLTLFALGPVLALPLLLYGTGAGIWSIARGALPMALFGPVGYAALIGRLAMPIQLAQAAAPSLGAVLLDYAGPNALLLAMCAVAVVNLAIVFVMLALVPRR